HSRAHRASGSTVKVPAGTGGTLRGVRLFEELYIIRPTSRPALTPFIPKNRAGGPVGRGMVRRRGVVAPHLGLGPQMGFGRQSNRKLRVWDNPRREALGDVPVAI